MCLFYQYMRHFFAKFLDPVFDTRKLHGSTGVVGCLHHAEIAREVEGLVHINDLDDDYYIYDEQHLMLLGQRNKKVYRLGDSVKVKCSRVDIDNREVFFDIVESEQDLKEIVPSEETASIIAEIKKEFGTKQEDN
mgnify:CR=1 FL=1